jgi:hypothetical protein
MEASHYERRMHMQVRMPDEDELVEKRRFMACCWGPGDPATVLAMVDDSGQLVDVLFTGQFSGNIPAPPRRSDSAYDLFRDPRKVGLLPDIGQRGFWGRNKM